jgi:hypothetical protein
MTSTIRAIAAALAAALWAAAAYAQSTPMTAPAPSAAPATTAKPAAGGGDWTGKWSGQIVQVGRTGAYVFNLTFSGKGGTTNYPAENCTGTLTRTGASGDYAFFTETITTGKYDVVAKKGCLSGSITLVKAGPALVMGWVAAHDGKPIIAYGTLTKAP